MCSPLGFKVCRSAARFLSCLRGDVWSMCSFLLVAALLSSVWMFVYLWDAGKLCNFVVLVMKFGPLPLWKKKFAID